MTPMSLMALMSSLHAAPAPRSASVPVPVQLPSYCHAFRYETVPAPCGAPALSPYAVGPYEVGPYELKEAYTA